MVLQSLHAGPLLLYCGSVGSAEFLKVHVRLVFSGLSHCFDEGHTFIRLQLCSHDGGIRVCCSVDGVEERSFVSSLLRFALSLESLFAEMRFDLLPENQHSQVGVGGLVHGFGLDAHAVLLRRQLVRAPLLVPEVKQT